MEPERARISKLKAGLPPAYLTQVAVYGMLWLDSCTNGAYSFMDTKQCAACGRDKPEGAFPKRTGRNGRRGTCRACQRRRKRGADESGSAMQAPPASLILPSQPVLSPSIVMAPSVEIHAPSETSSAAAEQAGGLAKRKRKRRRRRKTRKAAVTAHSHTPGTRLPFKAIKPFKGSFTYDPSLLNDRGTGMIQLRGRRESGKRWHTEIDRDIAVRMVQEGAAGILHPRLIHKLYTKSDFRLLILQRDNYVCHYCGRFGDTIDHVFPKSKGGLSTPANCVCACSECNLKKADTLPDYL